MKVDDIPGLHEAVSGKLVSNKRVQEWEQEFLSQQRRFNPKGEASRSGSRDQSFAPPQKDASGSPVLRHPVLGQSGSAKVSHSGAPPASGAKISAQRVVGIYNRVSGQAPVAAGSRSQLESTNRLDVRPGTRLAEVRAMLGRFKGHLVVEKEGVVSVWLGRKLHREEKCGVIAGIKAMLAHCDLTLGKLIINGIEEEI